VLSVSAVNGVAGNVGISVAGTYGSVSIGANGAYTYALNNAAANVQALKAGQTVTDTFNYTASDGNGGTSTSTLTVTVTGTNDVPVIGGASSGAVTEDATTPNLTISGALTIADPDAGQSSFTAQASTAGNYGSFTLNAAGNWTYTANNSQAAIQQLGAGQTLTESFTVLSSDGSASQAVTITINGKNDAPVAVADTIRATTGTTVTLPSNILIANDTDVEGNTLTVTSVTPGTAGASLSGGNISFTTSVTAGTYTFTYTASDGNGGTATGQVTVITEAGVLTPVPTNLVTSAGEYSYFQIGNSGYNLTFGAGNDWIAATAKKLTVSDVLNGGLGIDTLKLLSQGNSVEDINLSGVGAATHSLSGIENFQFNNNTSGGVNTITLGNTYYASTGFSGNTITAVSTVATALTVNASSVTDPTKNINVTGTTAVDNLTGGAGNDVLVGGGGADVLIGGTGSDTITYQITGTIHGDAVSAAAGIDSDTLVLNQGATIDLSQLDQDGGSGATLTGFENVNAAGSSGAVILTGSTGANTLTGGTGNDQISGGDGDDILRGGGGSDVLLGGLGSDVLVYDAADLPGTATVVYDGGLGADTLRFDGAGQLLDLTAIAQLKITGIENIALNGAGNNTLTLNVQDVLDLSGTTDQLVVLGNAGDVVNSTGQGWVAGANQTIAGEVYATYTNGFATLLIDFDITRNIT